MNNPSRVAFSIFGRDIYWYGVLMALSIVVAVAIAIHEAARKKINKDTALDVCIVAIPCGVIGARLYYVLFELEQYLANPISILYIWEGGLAVYGSILGGFIGVLLYCKRKKIRFVQVLDIVAPGLALAQALGRWGNFFNQEAYGLPVTNPDLLWFPLSVKIDVPWANGIHYFNGAICEHPFHLATFFYESMWCLLVFLVLWFLLRKRVKHDGDLFLWYALLYSFERMFIEGLRGDSLWLIPDAVRVSQALSLALFAGILGFLILRHAKEKKLGVLIWPAPLAQAEEAEEAEKVDSDAAQTQKIEEETASAPSEDAELTQAESQEKEEAAQPDRELDSEQEQAEDSKNNNG